MTEDVATYVNMEGQNLNGGGGGKKHISQLQTVDKKSID
jgi:hypothetical protein